MLKCSKWKSFNHGCRGTGKQAKHAHVLDGLHKVFVRSMCTEPCIFCEADLSPGIDYFRGPSRLRQGRRACIISCDLGGIRPRCSTNVKTKIWLAVLIHVLPIDLPHQDHTLNGTIASRSRVNGSSDWNRQVGDRVWHQRCKGEVVRATVVTWIRGKNVETRDTLQQPSRWKLNQDVM